MGNVPAILNFYDAGLHPHDYGTELYWVKIHLAGDIYRSNLGSVGWVCLHMVVSLSGLSSLFAESQVLGAWYLHRKDLSQTEVRIAYVDRISSINFQHKLNAQAHVTIGKKLWVDQIELWNVVIFGLEAKATRYLWSWRCRVFCLGRTRSES